MKHFLIYTNCYKDPEWIITNRIKAYLENAGQRCTIVTEENGTILPEEEIPQDACCMIVVGGDGTMLRAAWDTKLIDIPLIGVNRGTLGYMAEIETDSLEASLDKLIAGAFEVESRMMLRGRVIRDGSEIHEDWALNDVIISRSGSLRIVKLDIYVNGQFLNSFNADGMIVTTPTGSTGYNLSAGGPIVEPKAQLIMMTPVCPHTLNSRSIILSADDEVVIKIPDGRLDDEQQLTVNFDGAHSIPLKTGDSIHITKSIRTTEIIKINKVSFLDILHKKMSE